MKFTTMRTAAAAVSQTVSCGLAARTGRRRPVCDSRRPQDRFVSSSRVSRSATCPQTATAHVDDSQSAPTISRKNPRSVVHEKLDLALKRQEQQDALQALHSIPFDRFILMVAPEGYTGDHLEAQSLDEVLAGVSEIADFQPAAARMSRKGLRSLLKKYLDDQHIAIDKFLSYRNAMLAPSWPDARRHMVNIPDGRWPSIVLQRAIHTVTTPSEISDALALITFSIKAARGYNADSQKTAHKALRYCIVTLSQQIVEKFGAALHLVPRLTDALLMLIEDFPAHAASNASLVDFFTGKCTWVPDERTRRAVMQMLDILESQQHGDLFEEARRRLVVRCIFTIERSMKSSFDKTASSEQFVDAEMMDRLLQHDYGADAKLKQRALRSSVIVAGRNQDYQRTWQLFNTYEQFQHEHSHAITGSDLQLLSKALVRSSQGRKDAWKMFLQAERLWHSEAQASRRVLAQKTMRKKREREMVGTCLDLLEVMSKSTDVRVGKVFSMIGVYVEGIDYLDGKASFTGENFSQVMLQRREDPYAYAMIMQGMLLRKRNRCALTTWQAMLQRGVLPTVANLSLLLQNLFALRDVKTAMEQLHLWCEQGVCKPAMPIDKFKDVEVPTLSAPALVDIETLWPKGVPSRTGKEPERYKVVPDAILATVVFSGLHSCGSDGVEALWDAYQQTIHLFPDAPVLAMLLKASCPDSGKSRIGARFGRDVFRSVLFSKHPELVEYWNPLKAQLEEHGTAGWILSDGMGAKMERWLTSMFESKEAESTMPVPTGDLSALTFTSKLFEHYLRLLLHLHHSPGSHMDARSSQRELIDLLGWMKELHIRPSTTHIALTVLEVEEHLPPPVAARQMEVLQDWLIDWLGEDELPEEKVMQRHWQWKMERNGNGKGWFDRVRWPKSPTPQEELE